MISGLRRIFDLFLVGFFGFTLIVYVVLPLGILDIALSITEIAQ